MIKQCIVFAWLMANSAILHFYQIIIWVFVRPLSNPLCRNLISLCVQEPWMDVMTSIFPTTEIVVSGDFPQKDFREKIILANHQVDADWWYIWQLAREKRAAGQVKIILKDSLKHVPILGWGMRMLDFLFLKREWDKDKPRVHSHLQGMIKDKFPFWLLLFPEGTTIHTEAVVKSHKFAKQQNREQFSKVLLPRTTGLHAILEATSGADLDVYDMTIAYSGYSGEIPTYAMGFGRNVDTEVPSMGKLLSGNSPRSVHIFVKRWPSSVVKKDLTVWLDRRWKEKDEILSYFAEHQCFPCESDENIPTVRIRPKDSYTTIVKLWTSFFILLTFSPLFILISIPCYFLCVVWIVTSSLMRGALDWLPYLKNLLITNYTW